MARWGFGMAVQLRRHRFTTDDYHRLGEAGILGEDDRVELIDGEIVEMNPIGGPHLGSVNRINHLFVRSVGDRAVVHVQNPIRLDEHSEPQPDVCLLRVRADFYASGPPGPADVLLLIEVSDSSLTYDRQVKLPLYARGGIPEAWVLDLGHNRLLVFREPVDGGYATTQVLRRGQSIRPLAFPDLAVAVAALLG